uniref:Uncharacterized protein n=1 Tax=Arion vulgaris TaxID=1028688 RepID=A0A0B6Y8Z2_9EUPU
MKIRLQDKILVTIVLVRAGLQRIYMILIQSHTCCTSYLVSMPDHQLPKNFNLVNCRNVYTPTAGKMNFSKTGSRAH